ncbi:MAG TPA: DUF6644 family protein [Candidatus Acidoferrales bacterium]
MDDFILSFAKWLETTTLHPVMHYRGVWPTLEAFHFVGLMLLLGTVLLLDLRMLGVAKQLPLGSLHQLVLPWALAGFGVSLITGICFIIGFATDYVGNIAFYLKLGALLLLGINALIFYVTPIHREVAAVAPGEDAPAAAKMIATISVFLWFSVIALGRLIAFVGGYG